MRLSHVHRGGTVGSLTLATDMGTIAAPSPGPNDDAAKKDVHHRIDPRQGPGALLRQGVPHDGQNLGIDQEHAAKGERHRRRIARTQQSGVDAALEIGDQLGVPHLRTQAEKGLDDIGKARPLGDQHPEHRHGLDLENRENEAARHLFYGDFGGGVAGLQSVEDRPNVPGGFQHHLGEQAFLAAEQIDQGAPRTAGNLQDVADGGAFVAVFEEQPLGGVDHRPPPPFPAASGRFGQVRRCRCFHLPPPGECDFPHDTATENRLAIRYVLYYTVHKCDKDQAADAALERGRDEDLAKSRNQRGRRVGVAFGVRRRGTEIGATPGGRGRGRDRAARRRPDLGTAGADHRLSGVGGPAPGFGHPEAPDVRGRRRGPFRPAALSDRSGPLCRRVGQRRGRPRQGQRHPEIGAGEGVALCRTGADQRGQQTGPRRCDGQPGSGEGRSEIGEGRPRPRQDRSGLYPGERPDFRSHRQVLGDRGRPLVTANQETALATVTQLDPIYVDLTQPSVAMMKLRREVEAGRLDSQSEDLKVSLTVEGDAAPYTYSGTLQFSDVTVNQTTGTVTVRAIFPNPKHELLPGMFVRAQVARGVSKNALTVPQKALIRDASGGANVWVPGENNQAQLRPIAVSRLVGQDWVVENGLKAGDRVIVDGLQNLRPGVAVAPVPATAEPPQVASR